MGRTIGKSAIEVMRKRFPKKASEIETYADAFDVIAEAIQNGEFPLLPFVVHGTLVSDEQEHATITVDKTAAELYTAFVAGHKCIVSVQLDEGYTAELAWTMSATKVDENGVVTYKFFAFDNDGDTWKTGGLSGTDAVVFANESNG